MAKTVNYTPEMTETVVSMYMAVRGESEETRDAMVKEIAAAVGKNERSIRAKLSREQVNGESVYIPKVVVSKVTGATPAKKLELAETLRTVSGANINPENVAKMNKTDIVRLIEAFEARDADAVEAAEAAEVAETEASED